MSRSMLPVQAYESVTTRQGEVVRRVEMTTGNIRVSESNKEEERVGEPSLMDSKSSFLRNSARGLNVEVRYASSSLASESSSTP
jgi:hypothetical protein